MGSFFANLWDQVSSAFVWSFSAFRFLDVIDILLIAFIIYEVFIWVRRTKAWTLFKGIVVLILCWGAAKIFSLNMVLWVLEKAFSVGILAVVIIFQPEIRHGLEKLGRVGIIKDILNSGTKQSFTQEAAEELIRALRAMAKVKTGALICIEETEELTEYIQTGIKVDAAISAELLINIFEKNTPLHDGAVIIRSGRVEAATCYLPLSENQDISKELGTRHRAAIGLSEVSDSKIFIVSEETGQVSMATAGRIYRNISDEFIRHELLAEQKETAPKNGKNDGKWLKKLFTHSEKKGNSNLKNGKNESQAEGETESSAKSPEENGEAKK